MAAMPGSHLPPQDIEAAELFRKLKAAPRASEVVDFPRVDKDGNSIQQIRIQVLSGDQVDLARELAQRWINKKGFDHNAQKGVAIEAVIADRTAREVLALACVSVNPIPNSEEMGVIQYSRLFRNADDISALLTQDEANILFILYEEVQRKFGPYERTLSTQDEVTAWVKRLAEGGVAFPLSLVPSLQLADLTTSLAQRSYMLSSILAGMLARSEISSELEHEIYALGIGSSTWHPCRSIGSGLIVDIPPDAEIDDSRFLNDRADYTIETGDITGRY